MNNKWFYLGTAIGIVWGIALYLRWVHKWIQDDSQDGDAGRPAIWPDFGDSGVGDSVADVTRASRNSGWGPPSHKWFEQSRRSASEHHEANQAPGAALSGQTENQPVPLIVWDHQNLGWRATGFTPRQNAG